MTARTAADFTADEYTTAIGRAVAAHDAEGVYNLLLLMALHHPDEADRVREVMLIGLAMAGRIDAEAAS